jgi:outer membrane receptor protein involved in Fe transport
VESKDSGLFEWPKSRTTQNTGDIALNKRLINLTVRVLSPLVLLVAAQAQAKVTGKISGVVEDAKSGEPLVGASVRVVGTNLVTKTDEDGEYFMISVPVGEFDLAVSHIGFKTLTKKKVRVLVDLTTPVDFVVSQVTVELHDEVVVYATAPLIQRDLTASRIIFTQERLRNLPNIITVQSVLTNYPGVVVDRDDELHVRGGRSGQISYYYDGFSVQDPFMATAGIRIMPTALEELSLTSGGFTAEYGEALSGVVSAVTREGGSQYRGRLRVYQSATHRYDVSSGKWGDLSFIDNRSTSLNFSGPLPGLDGKRYTFFTAGEYLRDDSYLPHDWEEQYTGMAKIAVQPAGKLKLKSNVTYSTSDGALYEHRDVNGVSYDFNLDGLPLWEKEAYLAGLSGNYAYNERSVLSVTLNRFYTSYKEAPAHLMDLHWSDWPGYSEGADGVYNGTIHEENYWSDPDFSDPIQATGFTVGDDFDPTFRFRRTRYNSIITSFMSQVNKTNQIKMGLEYRKYAVEWDFKQFYNQQPYGERYTSRPTYASFFVEDKLEYHDFIVNLGVRFDYRDADISYNYTPRDTVARFKTADSKSRFAPRLGISFPVSEKSVLHFNYGQYYQVPRYVYLYTNLQGDRTSGLPLFGNPDLDPEETIAYELGLDHLIGSSLRLDITAYYKDINDLVTTREDSILAGQPLTKFTNDDYGAVTGFDVSMELLPLSNHLSGSVSYGFQIAKGIGSNAMEPYYTYITSVEDTLAPLTEYALDFDQRHTVTAVLDFRVAGGWSGNLLGLRIPGAWGISMIGYYGSGLPYTKTDSDGNRLGERNEGRLPASYSVDARFNKDFALGHRGNMLTFFIEVDNLFNRSNVLDVYTRTGLPDNDGQVIGAGLSLDAEEVTAYDRLYDNDPQNFSPPRTVRTGLEISF